MPVALLPASSKPPVGNQPSRPRRRQQDHAEPEVGHRVREHRERRRRGVEPLRRLQPAWIPSGMPISIDSSVAVPTSRASARTASMISVGHRAGCSGTNRRGCRCSVWRRYCDELLELGPRRLKPARGAADLVGAEVPAAEQVDPVGSSDDTEQEEVDDEHERPTSPIAPAILPTTKRARTSAGAYSRSSAVPPTSDGEAPTPPTDDDDRGDDRHDASRRCRPPPPLLRRRSR